MDIRAATDTVRTFWFCPTPRHRYAPALVQETACDAKAEGRALSLGVAIIIQKPVLQ